IVRVYLNEEFPARWLTAMASLDVTLLDFLCGYGKDKEYASSVASTEDLKTRTTHADSPTINASRQHVD
ncbi:hypothetical protein AVEN_101360-1, partial [Araneus ventricosus]